MIKKNTHKHTEDSGFRDAVFLMITSLKIKIDIHV